MSIDFEFRSIVEQAVAGMKQIDDHLASIERSSAETANALKQTSAATSDMEKKTTSAKDVLSATAKASALLTAEVVLLKKAFDEARTAASEMGRTDVVSKIDGMTASFKSARDVILSLPAYGRPLIDWLGDAAEGASTAVKLWAALEIKFKQVTGQIDDATASTLAAKLANSDYAASLDEVGKKLTGAKSAIDEYRKAQRAGYDEYRATLQSGYMNFMKGEIADLKRPTAPTRDIGGRGTPGQVYEIGVGAQPERFVPDEPGTFYPNGGGPAGGGGGGGPVTIVVNVPTQNFLGSRGDAIRLGNQLAPMVARGLGRAGSVPNAGPTRRA